jgi:protein-S-isoprenylcysteine O-methyltransferase Ste14
MPEPKAAGMRLALPVTAQLLFLSTPFLAAGTTHWTRGWIWIGLAVFSFSVFFVVARVKNPGFLKTRLGTRMPTELFDRVFMTLYMIALVAFVVVAGLGARWGWSTPSVGWLYAGLALHLAAMVPLGAAVATNPYLEGTVRIQSERGHVAVTSGPYAVVRHPMYAGVAIMFLAWPLVLGSLWAYIPGVCIVALFVFRTANEDRTLRRELAGYEDYTRRTRYRLVPGLW